MKKPDIVSVWRKYETSRQFKDQIGLYDTVRNNENFFIGKQWEGVEANGLPTPVFNFLKLVTLFQISTITSDNIAMQATAMASTSKYDLYSVEQVADFVNKQFQSIFERNRLVSLLREYMRNAAVDGDGCLYTYFDPDIETGQDMKGDIVTEVIENTRVHFGNPNTKNVQKQPYIIISRRMQVPDVRDMAESFGMKKENIEQIVPDKEDYYSPMDDLDDTKVTVLLYLWKDKKTGTIWKYQCTQKVEIEKPTDTDLKLYPLTWLNWDYVMDCYHGQALITGLIPNQIFINKLFAMSMISLMTTAYPKIVYDKTRIKSWDSRVGAAIGVIGGDMNTVAKIIDPASISPQIAQFIELAIQKTQSMLGASDVALGNSRPDNTSAIIALQRAANTPMELTKQNLYQSIEDLGRIYIDHMRVFYGTRYVQVKFVSKNQNVPLGMNLDGLEYNAPFDFSVLSEIPLSLKLDVGASAYWSEVASMQTLDNLLMQDKIGILDYLERVPDGYITKKQELLESIKSSQYSSQQNLTMQAQSPTTAPILDTNQPMQIPLGKGNGALQRSINETGVVK